MTCTIPSLFGFKAWFEKRFGYACELHDEDYVAKAITRKQADCKMAASIIRKGYFWLGLATYIYCRLLGWFFWYRRKVWNT